MRAIIIRGCFKPSRNAREEGRFVILQSVAPGGQLAIRVVREVAREDRRECARKLDCREIAIRLWHRRNRTALAPITFVPMITMM